MQVTQGMFLALNLLSADGWLKALRVRVCCSMQSHLGWCTSAPAYARLHASLQSVWCDLHV